MPSSRSRRLLIALGANVVLVFAVSRLLGLSPSTPAPTFPTSAEISCGEELAGRGGPLNLAARECFWAAYQQRRPAEFRTTQSTIEGDPITFTYRIRTDGAVEVIVDSSQDTFSNRGIAVLDCHDLVRLDDPVLPDPLNFGPGDGCVERIGS
jgi:hypothetical protein